MRKLLPALFAALDSARRADLSTTTGYGVWRSNGVGPQASWREALLDVGEDHPDLRVSGWRPRLADGCPEERHLIHDDLTNFNVLVGGERLTRVLD